MLQVTTFQNLFTFKNSPDHYILIVKDELNHVSRRERVLRIWSQLLAERSRARFKITDRGRLCHILVASNTTDDRNK